MFTSLITHTRRSHGWSRSLPWEVRAGGGQQAEHQQDLGSVAACLLWGVFLAQGAGALLPLWLPSPSPWAGGCCQLPRLACSFWSCAEASPPTWGLPVPVWPAHGRWVLAKPSLLKGLRLLFSLALGREEEAEGLRR